MRKKYHELSLAKKFSLTSIGFFFLTILVLTVLIQFLYEKLDICCPRKKPTCGYNSWIS